MRLSRTWLVGSLAFVLALTNAVVLVGVAYNRQPPSDSVLTLTERELGPQWSWMWREGENSGLSLRLQYRTEGVRNPRFADNEDWEAFSPYGAFGPVAWLDRDKLATLGFDVSTPLTAAENEAHYDRLLGRDVLLVLELDGPARAHALQAARDLVARREQEVAGDPEEKGNAQKRLQSAQETLQSEEQERSRLFIVDAGIDEDKLRQRYPDRAHYAICRGNVRPFVLRETGSPKLYGTVTAVRCESINVPRQFRAAVPLDRPSNALTVALARKQEKRPFTVQVAFGRRLEPWIMSAHAGST